MMNERLRSEIAAVAADSRSGATAILERALGLLQAVAGDRKTLGEVAEALCRAQPSMAALKVAAIVAQRAHDPGAALGAFATRTARASRIIARHAVDLMRLRRSAGRVRLVTYSRSHVVEQAIRLIDGEIGVEVACAEGRPALEGRGLAASLAASGIRVTLYSDAGVASAIRGSEAFLVGADAVGPESFINKVGTGPLAALASIEGVPVYVLTGREKVVPAQAFAELRLRTGEAAELWDGAPVEVAIANPYFETIPFSLVAAFITDVGVVSPDLVAGLSII
jgi:translation initiation factor 2B subunit (eIF-2B alpha/beta/delta family)